MAASSNLGHLHYGGSLNPKSGRFGPKPATKDTFKKLRRLETIVRLENAGFGEAATAAMLCVSVPRLRYLKKSPDYCNARIKITHGIIVDRDGELSLIKAQRREMLTQMLPSALQVLANEIQSQGTTLAERKHKVAIAQDILDREGLFAKISKTEIKPVDAFDFEKADEASRSIIGVIRGIAAPRTEHTAVAVAAGEEFSNSHTLSAVDQQAALEELEHETLAGDAGAELLELLPTDGTVN